MTIGELFIELGFKADTLKLKDFMRSVGELNLTSIASALGLGTMYEATAKIMNIADAAAMSIFSFGQVTGISTKEMQQFANFSEQMGSSSQDAQGSLKNLQNAMLQVQLGRGNMEPFILAGIDPTKTRNVFEVMTKIQTFLKDPAILDSVKRMVAAEFGLSESMIQVLKSSGNIRDIMKDQLFMTEEQVSALQQYHKMLISLQQGWRQIILNIGAALAPILDGLFKVVNFVVELIRNSRILQVILVGMAASAVIMLSPFWTIVGAVTLLISLLGLVVHYWDEIVSKIKSAIEPLEKFFKDNQWIGQLASSLLPPGLGSSLIPKLPGLGMETGSTTTNTFDVKISGVTDPEKASELAVSKIQRMLTDRYYHQKPQDR